MAVQSDDALVGRVLDDRYVIGERIARGGMASVFRATDERLDREVAVKVMHHALGDDQQFTDRFVREAKSAAKLNHRNVVSVFDQGKDGDVAYLVMEYVPGRTLRDIMRDEAPMPPTRALAMVEQVLIALSAAHAAKIIHRDVKPENVLITPDGDVKVADFGLARAVSAATTATGGTLIGTVSYLAPEIVLHEGADARSDVYAVGAMLFEMLTGNKPHVGDSPIQVAYKHVHEDIGPPSEIVDGIPAYLDALVARSTVRDRDQRSTDARVMLQQVRTVRRALEEGVTEDDDLTADLLPRVGAPVARSEPGGAPDVISDDTVGVAVAAGGASAAAGATTQTVHTGAGVRDAPEHTMQWGGGPVPPIA
ncbi:MAG: protein kinase, partial [Aeromicrobium sp.]